MFGRGYDVAVVGAGGVGAATAWHLARDGKRVLLLEQFRVGHHRGSSHGASRIFRVAYRERRYAELALRAIPWWHELEEESGEHLLDQSGQLDHGDTVAIEEIVANLEALDRPFDAMTGPEAALRWSGMRFGDTAVYSTDGGRCWADQTVLALTGQAVVHGADLLEDTPVSAIRVEGDHAVVSVGDDDHEVDAVVVAAGGWVQRLLGPLLPLPELTVAQAQPVHFAPRDGAPDWVSFIHHSETMVGGYGVWAPNVGVKVGMHDDRFPVDADERDLLPLADATARVVSYVQEWLPGLDPEPLAPVTCLYTSTPSEDFVIDRRGPIVVCSACSGHGFKFVPVLGRLAADLVAGLDHGVPEWHLA